MSRAREITVPQTKPATEWVQGRALQKVSPQERHARAQSNMVIALAAWADGHSIGRVGTEWEFRVTPPHEPTRPLVPDVAYLSYARLGYDEDEAAQIPYMAPDVAIEVRSPDDRQADIEDKVRVYLAAGTSLVLLIDPMKETLSSRDSRTQHDYVPSDVFTHDVLPGFSLEVGSLFRKPRRPA